MAAALAVAARANLLLLMQNLSFHLRKVIAVLPMEAAVLINHSSFVEEISILISPSKQEKSGDSCNSRNDSVKSQALSVIVPTPPAAKKTI